jgi:hypothetical protein
MIRDSLKIYEIASFIQKIETCSNCVGYRRCYTSNDSELFAYFANLSSAKSLSVKERDEVCEEREREREREKEIEKRGRRERVKRGRKNTEITRVRLTQISVGFAISLE